MVTTLEIVAAFLFGAWFGPRKDAALWWCSFLWHKARGHHR